MGLRILLHAMMADQITQCHCFSSSKKYVFVFCECIQKSSVEQDSRCTSRKHRRRLKHISINNRLIAGSLNAKLIAAIRREDISVSPTSAIVGCAMDIKIRRRSQVTSLPDSQRKIEQRSNGTLK